MLSSYLADHIQEQGEHYCYFQGERCSVQKLDVAERSDSDVEDGSTDEKRMNDGNHAVTSLSRRLGAVVKGGLVPDTRHLGNIDVVKH